MQERHRLRVALAFAKRVAVIDRNLGRQFRQLLHRRCFGTDQRRMLELELILVRLKRARVGRGVAARVGEVGYPCGRA